MLNKELFLVMGKFSVDISVVVLFKYSNLIKLTV